MQAATRALTDLGLTPLEAQIYGHLAAGHVDTGYGIAKALGKPRANVYQALRTLQLKGAVITEDGETQQCRAVPPAELLDRLERQFQERRARAEEELARLPDPGPDARIYELRSAEQVLERCRRMISEATTVVVVDAFPRPLAALAPDLEAAAERGLLVLVKCYARQEIRGARVTIEPRAERVRRRWPADWVNLVTDGCEVVIALLRPGSGHAAGRGVVQAVWSASPYLAWIVYGYMTQELVVTAVDAARAAGGEMGELGELYREVRDLVPLDAPGYRRLRRQLGFEAADEPTRDEATGSELPTPESP